MLSEYALMNRSSSHLLAIGFNEGSQCEFLPVFFSIVFGALFTARFVV
jgi:hypothetical protein